MDLFNKPNGQLDWSDIEPLLRDRVPEHEMLDYKDHRLKADYPIEKTIAAMGNTYGGDIIIGVGEGKDGIPVLLDGIEGLASADAAKFKQSIEQKNWKIRPPILGLSVESVPIPPEAIRGREGRSLVVVRVPQSDLVPHFIPGMGHYGRAASHNRMEDVDLATDRIMWLHDRRREHVKFRDRLLAWMDWLSDPVAWHTVWCVPEFPSPDRPLWERAPREKIAEAIPRLDARNEYGPFFMIDVTGRHSVRSLQHGWLWQIEGEPAGVYSDAEDNPVTTRSSASYIVEDRGLVAAKALTNAELNKDAKGSDGERQVGAIWVDWSVVVVHLLGVCQHASALYHRYGYWGPVQLGLEIGLNGRSSRRDIYLGQREVHTYGDSLFFHPPGIEEFPRGGPLAAPGRRLTEVRTCLAQRLLDEARQFATDSFWARAFDVDLSAPPNGEVARTVDSISHYLAKGA